jgi:hypothetical protein
MTTEDIKAGAPRPIADLVSAGTVVQRDQIGSRLFELPVALVLGSMVVVSAMLRFSFALRRPTITSFPDEYAYSQLARGLAESGRPLVRGAGAHFPALLEPVLAAPFWLFGSPQLAFRLTQAEGCVAMSLAAVPAYLIARRLALGRNLALCSAAGALASSSLLYASFLTADSIGYPLALAAVYAGIVTLDSPGRKAQLVFLLLACLASFSRVQYLLLLPVVVVGAVVVERANIRGVVRSVGVLLGFTVLVAATALAIGGARLFGYYAPLVHHHTSLGSLAHQLTRDAVLLPFSAGIVLVPGAILGLTRALRSSAATQRAFGAITVLLGAGLVVETVAVGAQSSGNYIERYLICVFPLLVPAFSLWARAGGGTRTILVLSAGLAVLAVVVRLPSHAAGGRWTDSPLLFAVSRLDALSGTGAAAVAATVAALLLVGAAVFALFRPGHGVRIAITLFLGVSVLVSVGATSWDLRGSNGALRGSFAGPVRWIDHSGAGSVTLIATPASDPGAALEQLFWNGSLYRAVRQGGVQPLDSFAEPQMTATHGGSLFAGGRQLTGAVLVDELGTWLAFDNARSSVSSGTYRLVQFDGAPRLAAEAVGLLANGWLATDGRITVWSHPAPVRLTLRLTLPRAITNRPNTVVFETGTGKRTIRVPAGGSRLVSFIIPAGSLARIGFHAADAVGYSGGLPVGVYVGKPTLGRISSGRDGGHGPHRRLFSR